MFPGDNFFKSINNQNMLDYENEWNLIWPQNRGSVYNMIVISKWSLILYPETQMD